MAKFTDSDLMPYGKYKGQPMADVPADYLIWLYDNDKCGGDVKLYIEENRDVLDQEAKPKKKD